MYLGQFSPSRRHNMVSSFGLKRKGLRSLRQQHWLMSTYLLSEVGERILGYCKNTRVCVLICAQEADEWRKLRTKLGRFADLWRAGEVELQSSVSLAEPNLTCPCLKVESDLFANLSGGVGRREYLDANFRRPSEACLGVCFLPAFRREPCDVD